MVDYVEDTSVTRKQVGIRLLYTLLFLIIFEVLKLIIQITVLFQFVYLLITKDYIKPLRRFSDRLSTYAYKVIRYVTLNENQRPFPFADFPAEAEQAEETVRFE
ncbi:MAG: DUF4389 domain-containing protein [Deltaproteobacteria bacterium]|nr:DUF4389 domain-containing protein [Deltaproteobacteria bacterium]